MLMQKTMKINNQGHLEINGCDTVDLAASFGTPLMIIDEALLREKCQKYYQAFTQNGGDKVFYASKAFLTTALARIIEDEGLGLDVVSGGELTIALAAGFTPGKILLHGNNKSAAELKMALNCGVGRIVIDNYNELEMLEQICADKGHHPSTSIPPSRKASAKVEQAPNKPKKGISSPRAAKLALIIWFNRSPAKNMSIS